MMKNFPVEVNGKEYWISRSVAICLFIFKEINGNLYGLVETRGKGAGDEIGKKCFVCGYLDYDETIKQCAIREAKEETGIEIDDKKLKMVSISSNPKSDSKQNVTIHYIYFCNTHEDYDTSNAVGGEKNEVEKVEWLKIGKIINNTLYVDIYEIMSNDWAFSHDTLMLKYLGKKYKIDYGKK